MPLVLHSHSLSTFTRRVRIAVIEKSIEIEVVDIDMAARKHREPAYLSLNPYGRVPTLQDGDFILYESSAILGYLESIYPQPALIPQDLRGRALVDMHMKLCDLQMSSATSTIIFAKRFLRPERWDTAAMDKAKVTIEKHLAVLERTLGEREYLVGDRFTLADLCYIPFVQFLPLMAIDAPPAVARWTGRLLARPSALQTAPAN
jgi:glutathione S-transferase